MIKMSMDPKVMKSALSGLVDQLKSKIDLNYVKTACKEQYGIETIEGVEHKDGDVVVINDQVACRLDFEVRFPMSIFITNGENSNSTLSETNEESLELDDLELLESNGEAHTELPPIDDRFQL
jgi:hypothetical protein